MRGGAMRYGLLLVGAYIVFLLLQIPAARVYAWLAPDERLPAQLYQISGSIWNGRAEAATIGDVRIDSLAWHFRPHALVTGRVEAAVEFSRDNGRVASISGRSLAGAYYLRDVKADFPLDDLAPLVTGARMGLSGELKIELDRVEVSEQKIVAARGVIAVENAGLDAPANVSLGGFTLTLETTDEGIKGVLKDDGGPLQADGILMLNPDGRYRLTAEIAARDPQRGDLRQALQFIGTPSPAGKVSLTRHGVVPLSRYLPL